MKFMRNGQVYKYNTYQHVFYSIAQYCPEYTQNNQNCTVFYYFIKGCVEDVLTNESVTTQQTCEWSQF